MDSSSIVCLCLFLPTLLSQITAQSTEISFPQFSSNDPSLKALGDIAYNVDNHSWIMNVRSAPSCALLVYEGTLTPRIQDSAGGRVASFSTSFTFKFTSPAQQQQTVASDANASDAGVATSLAFVLSSSAQMYRTLAVIDGSLANSAAQPDTCTSILTGDADFFGIAFDAVYNSGKNEPRDYFIGILNEASTDQVFEAGNTTFPTYNLRGNQTHSLSYLPDSESFTTWLDLTPERSLQVRLLNGSYPRVEKPVTPLFEYPNFQLPAHLEDYVSLLFVASSPLNHIQVHEITSWNFSSILTPGAVASRARKRSKYPIIFGSSMGGVGALLIMGFLLFWLVRRRRSNRTLSYSLQQEPRVFSYRELCNATKNFDKSEKLGSGGFGTVYKGLFEISGIDTLVAIKRINYESIDAKSTFLAEISSLSQIRHRNVVQLQGWCHEKDRLLLVYDYMPNGSLNQWLHGSGGGRKPTLPLKLRHHILEGIGTALEYLHKDCPQCILHRDIKSSNVMLDADFKAHLGDFGLARLIDHKKLDKTTMAAGTIGCMAPEMPYTGKATKKSDVYSFGILALEVVCGRRPLEINTQNPEDLLLLHKVWKAHERGILLSVVDPRLVQTCQLLRSLKCADDDEPVGSTTSDFEGAKFESSIFNVEWLVVDDIEVENLMVKNLLHLGLLCCLPNPLARPTMRKVVQILQQIGNTTNVDDGMKGVSLPPIPNSKPLGLYPSLEFSQTLNSA